MTAQQLNVDNIAHNLANANTAGFKARRAQFQDLLYQNSGWVQFGYRFSNDFAPFAVILVGLALKRYGLRWWTVGLVGLSIAINAWGVYWGVVSGW